jgi:hypothetical protein
MKPATRKSLFLSSFRPDSAFSRGVRALLLLAAAVMCNSDAAAEPAKRPSFDAIATAVAGYFASLEDFKPTDLIHQSNVAAALTHVTTATGWQVPDSDAIVHRALADDSFVVKQLATPNGRKFMRDIAKYPGTYSRLDRLSTISGGQQFTKDIVRAKGGADMIQYMATTPGGHNLGTMMKDVKQGVDLNKPTGRIYTAGDLLTELKKAYAKSSP